MIESMKPAYVPSALIVYLVVTGLLHSTAHTRAGRDKEDLIFGPTSTLRIMLLVLIVGFTCGAIYVSVSEPPFLLGGVIFGFIAVAGTFAFPSKIVVSSRKLSEVKWWGIRTEIQWKDVSRIEYHRGPSTTVVRSKSGEKVVHSGWNRDSNGFLTECERRSHVHAIESDM